MLEQAGAWAGGEGGVGLPGLLHLLLLGLRALNKNKAGAPTPSTPSWLLGVKASSQRLLRQRPCPAQGQSLESLSPGKSR